MNTPTHVISGIWFAQEWFAWQRPDTRNQKLIAASACIFVTPVLHLLLDEIPHYNWIVYLHGFERFHHHWLIREFVATIPVAIVGLCFARRIWPWCLLAAFGAMYPDIEKVAAFDFGMPKDLVLFRQHSIHLSTKDYGWPHWLLIAIESCLIFLFVWRTWRVSKRRESSNG